MANMRISILTVIGESPTPIGVREIHQHFPTHSTRRIAAYLTMLYQDGLVSRESIVVPKHGRRYIYQANEVPTAPDTGWSEREDESFNAAVLRAKPQWRRGELFTKQQAEEYRERFGRLTSHSPIWCGLK